MYQYNISTFLTTNLISNTYEGSYI